MNINPEFRRNLWLELTPARLFGMPLILGVVLLLAYLADDRQYGESVANSALGLFGLLTLLWGTRLSSESIISEIRDHTWDSQRMSIIGPWSMTWGKLLGSTIYPWYGALICLLVYFTSQQTLELSLAESLLLLVGCGLFAQAIGMLSSLQATRKNRRYGRFQTTTYLVIGMGASFFIFGYATDTSFDIIWYGQAMPHSQFFIGSLMVFTGWAVLGIYRLVRAELQLRSLPWAWALFTLFIALYVAGFPGEGEFASEQRVVSAFFVTLLLAYGTAFSEPKSPVSFRLILQYLDQNRWRRALEVLPLWLVTLPFLIAAGGAVLAVDVTTGLTGIEKPMTVPVLAMVLFLMRDVGIMLFLNLGKIPKRADMLTLLALILLYGVFPTILTLLKLESLAGLFWPFRGVPAVVVFPAAVLQVGTVFWLLVRRWRREHRDY